MDDRELSCLIQAPDNRGDNLVHVAAWVSAQACQRDKAPDAVLQELINEVGYEGRDLATASERVRVKRREHEFLLQVRLPYEDSAGRVVPILCYGLLPDHDERSFPARVAESLTAFLVAQNMPPDEEFAEVVENTMHQLARDSRSKNPLRASLRMIGDLFTETEPPPVLDPPGTREESRIDTVRASALDPPGTLEESCIETVRDPTTHPPVSLTEPELKTVVRAIRIAESHAEATPEMLELSARLGAPPEVESS